MTQYTIYATAANTVGNIVTVNSVGNMFSGLPIVFSGNTFGNITAGATYYIGAVIPGYPTSTITLSSLPGGAVYAVSNATGNMTAVFSSGGQQIINTVPPGESLTDAFTAVNVNFDQLFAAGPVNSNIQIANNTVLTTNTNGNINLVPNGIGAVVVNSSVIPDTANIRNLGSVNNRFSTIYAQYYNMSGNLTPENINTGNLTASGYISAVGNITGNYFFGNGSQLTGVVTSTGNIGFSGDAIYDLNGIYLENADLTQGATAAVVIPTNGSSDPIQVNNTYGNIALQTGAGSGITASWSFNNDGNLQLPDAGVLWNNGGLTTLQAGNNGAQIGSNDGQSYVIANVNGTYMQTLADTTNSLWHFGTDGNLTAPGNIRMSNIGGIYSTTSGYTVGLKMSNTEPSVKLVAHNHEWQFNSDGVLKFPAGYSTTYPSITMGEPGNLLIQGYINGNYTEDGGNVIVSGGFGDGNNGNATVLGQQVIVQAQLSTTNGSPTYSWTFDATGNLNAPGNISATGNVIANIFSTSGPSGNITGANVISATTISASGNVTGDFILGNIAFANGIPATYSNSNVESLLSAFGTNTISTTGNVSGGNFTLAGDTILNNVTDTITLQTGGDSWTFGTDGNLTLPGNLVIAGNTNVFGIFDAALIQPTNDLPLLSLSSGTNAGVSSVWIEDIGNVGSSNIAAVYANPSPGSKIVRIAVGQHSGNTGPNLWDFNANGLMTAPGNISTTGNITGSYILGNIAFANGIPATYGNANVANYLPTFSGNLTAGNISATGNITTSGNFVGNGATLSNVATQFKSAWTVTAGTGDYSFGVPANDTYQLWVRGNIPNGIIVYTATVALSNTNVPVLGVQYGWNYIAGGNLILNSLPSQFVGTAGAISNAAPTVTNTDVFTFNITNNSGVSQTVYYGWTKIS